MNPVIIIPARLGSTRLPDKPLADIAGVPMIVRAWRESVRAGIGPVYVAAAAKEIAAVVTDVGGKAVLTDPELPSGTDRVYAALQQIDRGESYDAVINMQGDIPAFDPALLHTVLRALSSSGNDMATLASPIHEEEEIDNPNLVKIVVAWRSEGLGLVLYFTRARAPYGDGPYFGHIGIYAYTRAALSHFVSLPTSELEKREKLEQLRALEAGMTIAAGRVETAPLSVDTLEDLRKARALFK